MFMIVIDAVSFKHRGLEVYRDIRPCVSSHHLIPREPGFDPPHQWNVCTSQIRNTCKHGMQYLSDHLTQKHVFLLLLYFSDFWGFFYVRTWHPHSMTLNNSYHSTLENGFVCDISKCIEKKIIFGNILSQKKKLKTQFATHERQIC